MRITIEFWRGRSDAFCVRSGRSASTANLERTDQPLAHFLLQLRCLAGGAVANCPRNLTRLSGQHRGVLPFLFGSNPNHRLLDRPSRSWRRLRRGRCGSWLTLICASAWWARRSSITSISKAWPRLRPCFFPARGRWKNSSRSTVRLCFRSAPRRRNRAHLMPDPSWSTRGPSVRRKA